MSKSKEELAKEKAERLEAALRENLRKRKSQIKGRNAQTDEDAPKARATKIK